MWSVLTIIKPALMSILYSYICLISYSRPLCCIYIYPDIIFQIFLPYSKPMISRHVTCYMTAVLHVSSLSKRKRKEKQNLYKIRKNKIK